MGAVEGAMREHDPLLPEQTRSVVTRPRAAGSRCRNGTSSGTLLGGTQSLPKEARGQISLPSGPASGTKCPTADSDLSTTDTTSRSQDCDSDAYPENLSPRRPPPEARVIILDWDDTLLPTSFLRDALKIYPNRYGSQSQRGRKDEGLGEDQVSHARLRSIRIATLFAKCCMQ
eukprot:Skav212609  [mRNA]  locus=scaffold2176:237237:243843:- [translate_table: standard]